MNRTPVGTVGYGGTPLAGEVTAGAEWVFDAVYTPIGTQFLKDAHATGLAIISGYGLIFYRGVRARAHFAAKPLEEARLRADLLEQGETP